MSDRAGPISNALNSIWGEMEKLAKCYFHVKKALKDNKHTFSCESNYDKFEADCGLLATFEDEHQFMHMQGLQRLDEK